MSLRELMGQFCSSVINWGVEMFQTVVIVSWWWNLRVVK